MSTTANDRRNPGDIGSGTRKIKVEHARKSFVQKSGAWVEAIRDLSFEVGEREYIAIVGPTGAGKSVLLDCLLGLKRLDGGRIEIAGESVETYLQGRKGRITRIFQEDRLLPWLSATDNVALGLQIRGVPEASRREAARGWLEAVGLSGFFDAFPSELSGGMRQRVNIARAFAPDPEIILLDEAFSAVDEITAARLRSDFRALAHQQKMTFLIVTHDIEEAIYLGHRILVFGTPAHLVKEMFVPANAAQDRRAVAAIRDEILTAMAAAGDQALEASVRAEDP